jgi:hypothetical protein
MARDLIPLRLLGASCGALALFALTPARPAAAQNKVHFSPDVTADLGSVSGSVVTDEDVALDDNAGTVTLLPAPGVGPIPPNAEVNGYISMAGGDKLVSFDTTIALPGLAGPAEPRDVVRFNAAGGTYSLFFDGSATGVPANSRVDAVALDASNDLLLSFDITVSLPILGPVDDEDVVRFAGGLFSMLFDGSAQGVAPNLDVDAVAEEPTTGDLLLSFDGSGTVGGVIFDDEDVVAFNSAGPSFSMYTDSSLSDATDWPPTDLIALPEPGFGVSMLAGLFGLSLLCRLRCRAH